MAIAIVAGAMAAAPAAAGAAPSPAPFGSWDALVARVYQDAVDRAPTASELSSWKGSLSSGAKTRGQLADDLRRSSENVANVDPVVRVYRAFLRRAPDAGGLTFWIGRKRNVAPARTWSVSQIAAEFTKSNEFVTKYGSLTNRQFVTQIYTDVLERSADPSGVDYWTKQLDTKKRTKATVMVGFSESNEYKRKQAENTDVSAAYVFLMGRAPTTAEAQDWTSRQKTGTTHVALLDELLGSAKYVTHITGDAPAAVPGAPTNVVAVAGDAKASVSWSAPGSNGGSAITGYVITPYLGATAQAAKTFNSTATSQVITGLSNGKAYTFKVAAINAVGTGGLSAASASVTPVASVTTPDAPTAVTAVAGDGQATVSWATPASNGGAAITGYVVTPFVGSTAQAARNFAGSATSQVVTGLTNGTTYTFKVAAKNSVGTGGQSTASAAVTPVAAATVPGAPTGVTAVAGNGQATVSWTAPATTGGASVTSYVVTPYVGATAQAATTFSSTATSQVVTGLTNGTTYTFKVAAKNSAGTGAQSGASNSVTPIAAATVPGAPTGVTAVAGNGQATVSWTAPASNGGSAITGYVVTPYRNGVAEAARSFDASTTSRTVTGIVNGSSYTFKIAAKNAIGIGLPATSAAIKIQGDSLFTNQTLYAGQTLYSSSGQYRLTMQDDGNLVLYGNGQAVWDSGTAGKPGARVSMQDDGNLVIYSSSGVGLWDSKSRGTGARFTVQDDANLVVYSGSESAVWDAKSYGATFVAATLQPGWYLQNSSRSIKLIMQYDGNFVLYKSNGSAIWDSKTAGNPGSTVSMQSDGNMVIYRANGSPIWSSKTNGNAGARLQVQTDLNVVIYATNGAPIWATNTAPGGGGGGVIGDDYPSNLKAAAMDALVDPWKFYNRECTSFVAWRLNNASKASFTNYMNGGHFGHANHWDDNARALGYTVNSTPAVGAVAQTDAGTYGHVAWVAKVNGDGTVTIEEYNRAGTGVYSTRTVSKSSFQYIHIKDMS